MVARKATDELRIREPRARKIEVVLGDSARSPVIATVCRAVRADKVSANERIGIYGIRPLIFYETDCVPDPRAFEIVSAVLGHRSHQDPVREIRARIRPR